MKLSWIILLGLLSVTSAHADELTVSSTAIVDNYDKACKSKGIDTQALIDRAESPPPEGKLSALRGLIHQESHPVSQPGPSYWDSCVRQEYVCGYWGYCRWVCQGGYVQQESFRCDTQLFVDSSDYWLNLVQVKDGNLSAELNAALAKGNVIYDEIDGKGHAARWVTVERK